MKRFFALAIVATMALPLYAVDGATVYKTKGCAGCHGADGSKSMPAMGVKPLNTPEVKAKSDADLTAAISKGKGKMPAQAGKLSPEEITATVAYVKSLK
jgi:mono/diheme cytochrome c family protein